MTPTSATTSSGMDRIMPDRPRSHRLTLRLRRWAAARMSTTAHVRNGFHRSANRAYSSSLIGVVMP